MKFFFVFFLISIFNISYLSAKKNVEIEQSKNCVVSDVNVTSNDPCMGFLSSCPDNMRPSYGCNGFLGSSDVGDNDPFEPFNRAVFWLNLGIDYVIIEPIAGAYKELVPSDLRKRVGNILQNLSEPVNLMNNLLQGELEDARTTIWRCLINSTLGLVGIFDVATDLGFPYKKEDLGLTFASWGMDTGPYLVLPILGPSNFRDATGRLGDYAGDPITWFTFALHSTTRTGIQVLDAKTDNIEITNDIRKNALDYYASLRTWYAERRKALIAKKEGRDTLDSPRPDEEE